MKRSKRLLIMCFALLGIICSAASCQHASRFIQQNADDIQRGVRSASKSIGRAAKRHQCDRCVGGKVYSEYYGEFIDCPTCGGDGYR